MTQEVVVLIAAPGSGKNTQSAELTKRYPHCFHFELSAVLEHEIKNSDPSDPKMAHAKKLFEAGELLPSDMVLKIVIDTMKEKANQGLSIVFNGPFRRLGEAEAELPVLESLYPKNKIHIVNIDISEEESIRRNVARRVCVNRHVIPDFEEYKNITVCPFDGAELQKRTLDTEEKARHRFEVYKEETEPVLKFFQDKGYEIIRINGEQDIQKVHQDILRALHLI